jgi:putative hydrolase of the HAD superfamily
MIKINQINKEYVVGTKVVKDLTLDVRPGEIFGFLGPNGAGKTTTLKMITGVSSIDSGNIEINGVDIAKEPLEAKKQFGFVPDSPDMFLRLKGIEYLNFIADIYRVDEEIRKERIVHFSTTLEWLRSEGMNDIEGFLAHVHPENEADELTEQPGLREFLISLDYPKSILTNAPKEHSMRVLKKLGIEDLFEAITDVRECDFMGKPYPIAYQTALKKVGADVETTLFFDDMIKYVDGWKNLGGTAILIGDKNGRALTADAKSMQITEKSKNGRVIRLPSIYEAPELIKII